jgi:hypothetical protein
MQSNTDILNELKELSPVLAGLEKVNVFTVPSGYFDVLSNDILASLNEQFPGNFQASAINTDEIPEGYFDTLADSILHKIKMQAKEETAAGELRALSPMLYSIQGENVFEVPYNYFNNLPATTLSRINNATVTDELKILSPVLFGIQNKNVFEVPQGYFETLAGEIKSKVQPQQAKVISMPKRSTAFFKYAAAAVFAGLITFGIFKFTDRTSVTATEFASADPIVQSGWDINQQKTFDQELAKVTDADIINYLKENGESLDIAAVTNNIDEKELPTQDDYLLDEKALDKYLDGVTVGDLKN